ncbi:DUF1810 domain-containing protein [Spirosoma rigui]|uniref:DUF1810 domain-containing protein n=1 Tax=Spirosoma rigui TaxID=564064 RepID=UPI0009AF59A8|nr:DUF1810 domain-containing protein [Spirosoma rigui]
MVEEPNLTRFLTAQATDYDQALAEIRAGRKRSHWMWYIFPQLAGLGYSSLAQLYGINGLQEAADYLAHPVLGSRLVAIAHALLGIEGKTATQIMGTPDDLKLRSSMTLFNAVEPTNPVFQDVLDKYYNGEPDPRTLTALKNDSF